ncbi:ribonuclease P protein component [Congregibacter sp.]|uniref:ribonuclease P protein component n=1 Tax=Congregibacter sp. TaxID=2744308 RepID=UPI003F6CF2EA
MAATFRPSQRLLTADDYRQVFKAPDQKAGQKELLLLARRNNLARHRLGLAVAKKHVPTAVKRNAIKRLTREHFRALSPSSPSTPSFDVVVLTRPGARDATASGIKDALSKQFARLGLTVASQ